MNKRYAGILLPLSSLPGPYGIGTMGRAAYTFVDYLKASGQSYWQILPLGPTSIGDSPYQTFSTFAGSPYYIDLGYLIELDLISAEEALMGVPEESDSRINYGGLFTKRIPLLKLAFSRLTEDLKNLVIEFKHEHEWLEDYALFMTLKEHHEMGPWYTWSDPYKYRDPMALEHFRQEHNSELCFWAFVQYLFTMQWEDLHLYANQQGIKIIGDMPLYVAHDSVEVWRSPDQFQLDESLLPTGVAGYPPDAFSELGQLWGNPLYNWNRMKEDDYAWWVHRLEAQQKLYDIVRLDHFIGFDRYWCIPYGDSDARGGRWLYGPGLDFFKKIRHQSPDLVLIAEDLGNVTDSVRRMQRAAGLPSMRVMQFGFDPYGDSENLPHHFNENIVAYTGTHDNTTVVGWWSEDLPEDARRFAAEYLHLKEESIVEAMLRALYQSGAAIAITTMQDLLHLGSEARMNTPNTMGNWTYRMQEDYAVAAPAHRLYGLVNTYRRLPDESIF